MTFHSTCKGTLCIREEAQARLKSWKIQVNHYRTELHGQWRTSSLCCSCGSLVPAGRNDSGLDARRLSSGCNVGVYTVSQDNDAPRELELDQGEWEETNCGGLETPWPINTVQQFWNSPSSRLTSQMDCKAKFQQLPAAGSCEGWKSIEAPSGRAMDRENTSLKTAWITNEGCVVQIAELVQVATWIYTKSSHHDDTSL